MLSPPASADSQRLVTVQALLARLILELDVEHALITHEDGVISPQWVQDGLRKLPNPDVERLERLRGEV
jgi:hypothetical protein